MKPGLNIDELIKKTSGIELSDMHMSTRLYNCLRRGGYKTLTDIMVEPYGNFSELRNFGEMCAQELLPIIQFVKQASREEIIDYCSNCELPIQVDENGKNLKLATGAGGSYLDGFSVLDLALKKHIDLSNVVFKSDNGDICEDLYVKDLRFSNRAYNVLMANNILTLRQVASLSCRDLMGFSRLGKKILEEIAGIVIEHTVILGNNHCIENEEISQVVEKIIMFYEPIIDVRGVQELKRSLFMTVNHELDNVDMLDSDSFEFMMSMALKNPLESLIKRIIRNTVSEKAYCGIEEGTLLSLVTKQDHKYDPIIKAILDNMIQTNQIRLISGKLYRYKSFLTEWIDTLEGDYKFIIESRCQGMTLDEIGYKLGLTRERIRQILLKILKKRPALFEDDYGVFVENYDFEVEEFCTLFELSPFQVNYLLMTHKHGSQDIQAFLYDDSVPAILKGRVSDAFRKKIVILDGECVPLKREELINQLLQLECSESELTIEEFEKRYLEFLEENGLSEQKSLRFPNHRAFEARITDSQYTLVKTGHRIRYYDTEAVCAEMLLEEMHVWQYLNMEISTLKWFRDWPGIMEKYDIRDEYELHNLLRKRMGNSKYSITISRMPLITVGAADRTKQVKDLLRQLAPITNTDLAKCYEDRYGVRRETVLANFLGPIDIYYHNGNYDITQPELSEEEFHSLKLILTEEAYLWDKVVELYCDMSSKPNLEAINAMTLKKLGFKVYSQYVIRSDYASADAYFTKILLQNDCIDLRELEQGLRSIQSFYSALTNLCDELELIEVDRDVFYKFDYFSAKYLIDSKDQLKQIADEILSRLDNTEYFSIDIIASDPLIQDIEIAKQNPYILNSLIRVHEDYKTGRIANIFLATKKWNELSLLGLIIYVLNDKGELGIRELVELLKNEYGMIVEKARVRYVIQESEFLFYDEAFDRVALEKQRSDSNSALYLGDSYLSDIIKVKSTEIEQSDTLIARFFWQEKYAKFVDYCGFNDCFLMKDILKLDFNCLNQRASEFSTQPRIIGDIVERFAEWVDGLNEIDADHTDNESIIGYFFK